jgi:hypothetical protein
VREISGEQPVPPSFDVRAFNRVVIDEFRANNGRMTDERFRDVRLVLLTPARFRWSRSTTGHEGRVRYRNSGLS